MDNPVVLLDRDSGRCWVIDPAGDKFRASTDGPWLPKGQFAPPGADDLAENFADISGKEAESLLMSARASSSPE